MVIEKGCWRLPERSVGIESTMSLGVPATVVVVEVGRLLKGVGTKDTTTAAPATTVTGPAGIVTLMATTLEPTETLEATDMVTTTAVVAATLAGVTDTVGAATRNQGAVGQREADAADPPAGQGKEPSVALGQAAGLAAQVPSEQTTEADAGQLKLGSHTLPQVPLGHSVSGAAQVGRPMHVSVLGTQLPLPGHTLFVRRLRPLARQALGIAGHSEADAAHTPVEHWT